MSIRRVFGQQRLQFCGHAVEGMQRRGITEEDVEAAVNTCDTTFPGSDRKRENLVKIGTTPSGRRLCVVVKRARERMVVTAYWGEQS